MKNSVAIPIVILVVVGIGWLALHKRASAPAPQSSLSDAVAPQEEITPAQPEAIPAKKPEEKQPDLYLRLTEKDTGKTYTIPKGKTFTVTIPERDGGYDTTEVTFLASMLELGKRGLQPSPIPGARGTRLWTLTAISEGTSTVTITASTEKGGAQKELFFSTIIVK